MSTVSAAATVASAVNERRGVRSTRPRSAAKAVLLGLVLLCASIQQAAAISLIRDAETERFIRVISEPIFAAGGLNPASVDTYLVNASSINAFVTGGQNVFMHTGTIQQAETPNEILGVMGT